jgi:hypothetical protein
MQLMTKEIEKQMPKLGETDGQGLDAVVQVKFFTPWDSWTWYATEFDGEDTFFGYVKGLDNEFGYFSLSELKDIDGPVGLRIERDLYFEPKPLKDLVN